MGPPHTLRSREHRGTEIGGIRSVVLIKPRKSAIALAKRVSLAKFVSFDGLGSGISF